MKLPNPERAVIDAEKLKSYCLSADHPRGRHKARVFASALGFTADHAEELREILLAAACTHEVISGEQDGYGQRYYLDVRVTGLAGQATVRSGWIVCRGEDFARLTSCYVL